MASSQNGTNCTDASPSASEVIANLNSGEIGIVAFFVLCTITTFGIFIEEVIFIVRTFQRNRMLVERAKYIIYILGLYPVISIVGTVGFMVPRSATVVDLVCETYFACSLYAFVRLLVLFMGGPPRLLQTVSANPDARIVLRSPPCCCLCYCLPNVKVSRKSMGIFVCITLQLAFIRPTLLFIAAVAWTDGAYEPGSMDPNGASLYIKVLNMLSTFIAMWGLNILKNLLAPYLSLHRIVMKFVSLQLTLMLSVIPGLIIGLLSSNGLLPCTHLMGSKDRSARVNHCVMIVCSLLLAILARFQYRRREDAIQIDFDKHIIETSNPETAAIDIGSSEDWDANVNDEAEEDNGVASVDPIIA